MTLPDGPTFTSTLIDVTDGVGFSDETVVGETRVVVHHRIEEALAGRRVIYVTEVTGPDEDAVGATVTGDFDRVLAALKALAERA